MADNAQNHGGPAGRASPTSVDPSAVGGLELQVESSEDGAPEDRAELTPLQKSPVRPAGGSTVGSAKQGQSNALMQPDAEAQRRRGADVRQSLAVRALGVLFWLDPLLDLALLLVYEDDTASEVDGEIARVWARAGRIVVQVFTLLLGLYCLYTLRRWQSANSRDASGTTTQAKPDSPLHKTARSARCAPHHSAAHHTARTHTCPTARTHARADGAGRMCRSSRCFPSTR